MCESIPPPTINPMLTKQASYWFGPGASKTIAREKRPPDPVPPKSLCFTLQERSSMAQIRRHLRRSSRGFKYGHMFCKRCKNMNFLVHLGTIESSASYYDPCELERERNALKANGWRY